jgi:hypothetical protein
MVGSGVVPRHSDFKNLDCQMALSAITGAKGILLRCKTEIVWADLRAPSHIRLLCTAIQEGWSDRIRDWVADYRAVAAERSPIADTRGADRSAVMGQKLT